MKQRSWAVVLQLKQADFLGPPCHLVCAGKSCVEPCAQEQRAAGQHCQPDRHQSGGFTLHLGPMQIANLTNMEVSVISTTCLKGPPLIVSGTKGDLMNICKLTAFQHS